MNHIIILVIIILFVCFLKQQNVEKMSSDMCKKKCKSINSNNINEGDIIATNVHYWDGDNTQKNECSFNFKLHKINKKLEFKHTSNTETQKNADDFMAINKNIYQISRNGKYYGCAPNNINNNFNFITQSRTTKPADNDINFHWFFINYNKDYYLIINLGCFRALGWWGKDTGSFRILDINIAANAVNVHIERGHIVWKIKKGKNLSDTCKPE